MHFPGIYVCMYVCIYLSNLSVYLSIYLSFCSYILWIITKKIDLIPVSSITFSVDRRDGGPDPPTSGLSASIIPAQLTVVEGQTARFTCSAAGKTDKNVYRQTNSPRSIWAFGFACSLYLFCCFIWLVPYHTSYNRFSYFYVDFASNIIFFAAVYPPYFQYLGT